MSYIMTNFYKNPGPMYHGSDVNEPVPGWGINPNLAGPARVGVGIDKIFVDASRFTGGTSSSTEIPAWYYVAGAAAASGAALLAYNFGLFG